jgi:hypothetical protein
MIGEGEANNQLIMKITVFWDIVLCSLIEMSANIDGTTWWNIPEHSDLHAHHNENLISQPPHHVIECLLTVTIIYIFCSNLRTEY